MGLGEPSRQTVPKDVVKQLGLAGVARLLRLMSDAYLDLKARGWVTASSQEDDITEEWFTHILQRWRDAPEISLYPIPQKADATKAKARGKRPTIDFCFRDRFDTRSYFGAECKLLDEGHAPYLAAYLDSQKGIGRFLDGRYAAHTGAGAMVGYIRSGECDAVARSLFTRIQELKGKPRLKKSSLVSGFDQLYESQHERPCPVVNFVCYHLLFGFGCPAA